MTQIPELESPRLRLRGWRPADAAEYGPILRHPEVARNLGSGFRYTAKRVAASALAPVSDVEARRAVHKMRRHWDRHGFGQWAVELRATGALIGRIGFVHQADWPVGPDRTEIGWALAPAQWGEGFATEGARLALGYGFGRLHLTRVISITAPANVRSRRVMERIGMRRQGFARWHGSDCVWYAIDRDAWTAHVA